MPAAEDGDDALSYLPAHADKSRAVDLASLHIVDIITAHIMLQSYCFAEIIRSLHRYEAPSP
jgi:hypothetical protein